MRAFWFCGNRLSVAAAGIFGWRTNSHQAAPRNRVSLRAAICHADYDSSRLQTSVSQVPSAAASAK